MYSVNSSNLTGTTLFDHWPYTRYNIICPLGKYQIYTTLFAHWANTKYNINVCPLGNYQIQHCLPRQIPDTTFLPIGQIPGTTICQCFCLYLFLILSAQAMACCLGVKAWGLRLGDTRLFCPSLSMGREEEDCSPITVRSTCELISSSRNTCSLSF